MSKRSRRRDKQRRRRRREDDLGEGSLAEELAQQAAEKEGMSSSTKMYYIKIIIGGVLGSLAGLSFELLGLPADPTWWITGLLGLGLSILIVRFVLGILEDELTLVKLILSGTISYLIIFIFTSSTAWMIAYVLLHGGF